MNESVWSIYGKKKKEGLIDMVRLSCCLLHDVVDAVLLAVEV